MISKSQLKLIRALGQKKQRKQLGKFLVQGEKNILELLNSNLDIEQVFASSTFLSQHKSVLKGISIEEANEAELSKASTLMSNNSAIAIVRQPAVSELKGSGKILVLDGVSDPGNLGTIIRLADWYGVVQVICSEDCADIYNPKTISATMGSFARVNTLVTNIVEYLSNCNLPVYGAYLGGDSVHDCKFTTDMVLVMGSESHGIRDHISSLINNKITIPSFGHAESLNVAMAAGIILDNVVRQHAAKSQSKR
ncbi:MAG: RNA methyltransferase [Gammaproteobacteria bacterium]|nr:RNA methyltransferase [Gammaproteobacteria bacterium]